MTWLRYIVYNLAYISNVLVGIDGNLFGAEFIMTVIAGMLVWLFALMSAVKQKNEREYTLKNKVLREEVPQ